MRATARYAGTPRASHTFFTALVAGALSLSTSVPLDLGDGIKYDAPQLNSNSFSADDKIDVCESCKEQLKVIRVGSAATDAAAAIGGFRAYQARPEKHDDHHGYTTRREAEVMVDRLLTLALPHLMYSGVDAQLTLSELVPYRQGVLPPTVFNPHVDQSWSMWPDAPGFQFWCPVVPDVPGAVDGGLVMLKTPLLAGGEASTQLTIYPHNFSKVVKVGPAREQAKVTANAKDTSGLGFSLSYVNISMSECAIFQRSHFHLSDPRLRDGHRHSLRRALVIRVVVRPAGYGGLLPMNPNFREWRFFKATHAALYAEMAAGVPPRADGTPQANISDSNLHRHSLWMYIHCTAAGANATLILGQSCTFPKLDAYRAAAHETPDSSKGKGLIT